MNHLKVFVIPDFSCLSLLSLRYYFNVWFHFQRRRHLWRLDAKAITLFVDEKSSRYYKVSHFILKPSVMYLRNIFQTTQYAYSLQSFFDLIFCFFIYLLYFRLGDLLTVQHLVYPSLRVPESYLPSLQTCI